VQDLLDQPPQAHAWNIHRDEDASGSSSGNLHEKFLREVVRHHGHGFAFQRYHNAASLDRGRAYDVNDFGHALGGLASIDVRVPRRRLRQNHNLDD
jgi:hypothetical protein